MIFQSQALLLDEDTTHLSPSWCVVLKTPTFIKTVLWLQNCHRKVQRSCWLRDTVFLFFSLFVYLFYVCFVAMVWRSFMDHVRNICFRRYNSQQGELTKCIECIKGIFVAYVFMTEKGNLLLLCFPMNNLYRRGHSSASLTKANSFFHIFKKKRWVSSPKFFCCPCSNFASCLIILVQQHFAQDFC